MLVAILTIMFLGGSGAGIFDYIDEASDLAKAVMIDKNQYAAAKTTFKSMKNLSKDHDKQLKALSKSLKAELGDRQADNAEIDEIWDQFTAMNNSYTADMIDLRFKLKTHVSREEWEQIFSED